MALIPRFRKRLGVVALGALAILASTGAAAGAGQSGTSQPAPARSGAAHGDEAHGDDRIVVGHRGASGYRPEHTLASYELAARMGADYIEPDLVTTSDGALIARHEPEIGGTTDVAQHPEFADRKTTKRVDGEPVTGWFAEDFTLAEIKTLRAEERIPEIRPNNTIYDGRFEIPTLQEVIDLSERLSRELHRPIGIFPETKHPTYFREQGLALEPKLVEALRRNHLDRPNAKVQVQSFEVANLKELDDQVRVPLVQLTSASGAPYDFVDSGDPRTYEDMTTPEGLREIATYADGLGPAVEQIVPLDEGGNAAEPTSLVDDSHATGLDVVPYTFRAENEFLPADYDSSGDPARWGDALGWAKRLWETGVDGLFADHPDIVIEAARSAEKAE